MDGPEQPTLAGAAGADAFYEVDAVVAACSVAELAGRLGMPVDALADMLADLVPERADDAGIARHIWASREVRLIAHCGGGGRGDEAVMIAVTDTVCGFGRGFSEGFRISEGPRISADDLGRRVGMSGDELAFHFVKLRPAAPFDAYVVDIAIAQALADAADQAADEIVAMAEDQADDDARAVEGAVPPRGSEERWSDDTWAEVEQWRRDAAVRRDRVDALEDERRRPNASGHAGVVRVPRRAGPARRPSRRQRRRRSSRTTRGPDGGEPPAPPRRADRASRRPAGGAW